MHPLDLGRLFHEGRHLWQHTQVLGALGHLHEQRAANHLARQQSQLSFAACGANLLLARVPCGDHGVEPSQQE
ncbi:MAG: hypothetical protein O9341_06670, partial [Paucibacter sp.]|nr:hypothetical protein [Roseateles sp.]